MDDDLEQSYEAGDTRRRLFSGNKIGYISELRGRYYKVKLLNDVETEFMPTLQENDGDVKSFKQKTKGERVLVSFIDGEINNGVILGSLPKIDDDPKENRLIYQDEDGSIFKDGDTFVVKGKLRIDGPVDIKGVATAEDFKTTSGVSAVTHKHMPNGSPPIPGEPGGGA